MEWTWYVWADYTLADDEVRELQARWVRLWESGQVIPLALGQPVVYSTDIELSGEDAATLEQAFRTRFTRSITETIARLDRSIANVRRYA